MTAAAEPVVDAADLARRMAHNDRRVTVDEVLDVLELALEVLRRARLVEPESAADDAAMVVGILSVLVDPGNRPLRGVYLDSVAALLRRPLRVRRGDAEPPR